MATEKIHFNNAQQLLITRCWRETGDIALLQQLMPSITIHRSIIRKNNSPKYDPTYLQKQIVLHGPLSGIKQKNKENICSIYYEYNTNEEKMNFIKLYGQLLDDSYSVKIINSLKLIKLSKKKKISSKICQLHICCFLKAANEYKMCIGTKLTKHQFDSKINNKYSTYIINLQFFVSIIDDIVHDHLLFNLDLFGGIIYQYTNHGSIAEENMNEFWRVRSAQNRDTQRDKEYIEYIKGSNKVHKKIHDETMYNDLSEEIGNMYIIKEEEAEEQIFETNKNNIEIFDNFDEWIISLKQAFHLKSDKASNIKNLSSKHNQFVVSPPNINKEMEPDDNEDDILRNIEKQKCYQPIHGVPNYLKANYSRFQPLAFKFHFV